MDAAGLDQVALLGASEGGLMAQLFAATHPERVDRLILANDDKRLCSSAPAGV